ncbi:MAG: putative hydro-lyase [Gemmatales bacterium]|nr:putative hydro-lyase [Gemmatales bacterium]MDW7994633.1 putative hydro-lyase [Gemmatales bacterium]
MIEQLRSASGRDIRLLCRDKTWTAPTAGLALGYVQANLVIVPQVWAFEFLLFCYRNPRACPLLEVTEPGCPEPRRCAPGADLRTDLPRYCIFQNGQLVAESLELHDFWRDDLVAFLLGCSFSFERALLRAGLPVRHVECQCNVPMYKTNIPCEPAGRLHGSLVVSMRPLKPRQALEACQICSRFPLAHGPPLHWGDPAEIGILDLTRPDFGDPVPIYPGEVPVFWACGVTSQTVLQESGVDFVITHKPGHMFLTDWRDEDLARSQVNCYSF